MKIKFIGTGSGKTSLARYHSSFVIFSAGRKILFDAGDSVSRALLESKISFGEIDSIILSHYHADHFAGIGSLITQMKLTGRRSGLTIFTHKSLVEPLRGFLNSCYMFNEVLNFELKFFEFESGEKTELTKELSFIPRQNMHIENKHKIDNEAVSFISSSFLFISDNGNIFVSSDIGGKEDLKIFADYSIHSAVIEITHINLAEILEFADESGIIDIVLTHIDDGNEDDIIAEIGKISRDSLNIRLAFDGLLTEI